MNKGLEFVYHVLLERLGGVGFEFKITSNSKSQLVECVSTVEGVSRKCFVKVTCMRKDTIWYHIDYDTHSVSSSMKRSGDIDKLVGHVVQYTRFDARLVAILRSARLGGFENIRCISDWGGGYTRNKFRCDGMMMLVRQDVIDVDLIDDRTSVDAQLNRVGEFHKMSCQIRLSDFSVEVNEQIEVLSSLVECFEYLDSARVLLCLEG